MPGESSRPGRPRRDSGASSGLGRLRSDSLFDIGRLGLSSGEGRRFELEVPVAGFDLAGQRYTVAGGGVRVLVDTSRTTTGFSLRLRFTAAIEGPCMRCLEAADQPLTVDAREVDQPGGGEELRSPYLEEQKLDLAARARDALALALPTQIVCRPECLGLCPVCGENLNTAPPDHRHEPAPDPRWAALRGLRLE